MTNMEKGNIKTDTTTTTIYNNNNNNNPIKIEHDKGKNNNHTINHTLNVLTSTGSLIPAMFCIILFTYNGFSLIFSHVLSLSLSLFCLVLFLCNNSLVIVVSTVLVINLLYPPLFLIFLLILDSIIPNMENFGVHCRINIMYFI